MFDPEKASNPSKRSQVTVGTNPEVSLAPETFAQQSVPIVVARLTHGHVGWILGRAEKGDVQLVGIYEPDREVVDRCAKQFGFDTRLVHTDFGIQPSRRSEPLTATATKC